MSVRRRRSQMRRDGSGNWKSEADRRHPRFTVGLIDARRIQIPRAHGLRQPFPRQGRRGGERRLDRRRRWTDFDHRRRRRYNAVTEAAVHADRGLRNRKRKRFSVDVHDRRQLIDVRHRGKRIITMYRLLLRRAVYEAVRASRGPAHSCFVDRDAPPLMPARASLRR